MCDVEPFPLQPTCAHYHDKLDRSIMLFLINGEGGRFTVNVIQQEVKPGKPWARDLIKRRLDLLKKFGWAESGTNQERVSDKWGWVWQATSKAKEAHQIWLWSGIIEL